MSAASDRRREWAEFLKRRGIKPKRKNWFDVDRETSTTDTDRDVVTDKIRRDGGDEGFDFSDWLVQAGHAQAGHATSSHGTASLIDVNDPIYQLLAPRAWMSQMLARGKEYIGSATEDAVRLQKDQAIRSGVSSSSPAFMYAQSMMRREQGKSLANALRDANLAWVLPAADRRAGALGQNANMLTTVSLANADADTRVSMANAGFETQTSIANAGFETEASARNADMWQDEAHWQSDYAERFRQNEFERRMAVLNLPGDGSDPYIQNTSFLDGLQGAQTFYDAANQFRSRTPSYTPEYQTEQTEDNYAYNVPQQAQTTRATRLRARADYYRAKPTRASY